MTFNQTVQNTELPPLVELFRFTSTDPSEEYFYCTGNAEIVFQGNTYSPAPIKRTTFKKDAKLKRTTTTISTVLNEQALKYLVEGDILPFFVTIYQAFTTEVDTKFHKIFFGKGSKISYKNGMVNFEMATGNKLFQKKLPGSRFTSACNHKLYSAKCGVIETNYQISFAPVFSGNTITHTSIGTQPDGYWTDGKARLGDYRFKWIVKHVGNTITLHTPFPASLTTDGVTQIIVSAGCDKLIDTCNTKFGNIENNESYPFISSRNPAIYGFK